MTKKSLFAHNSLMDDLGNMCHQKKDVPNWNILFLI